MSQPDKDQQSNQHIKELNKAISAMPRLPGVYLMKSAESEIIYIGKAKSLRERVRSYFNFSDERAQVKFLLKKVAQIETIVTGSEEQAFILERDLINRHKPRYNIRLKDDKAYLSIRLDESVEWPKLELVRKVDKDQARYFGPYSFTYELRALLELINKTIPLRTCSDTVLYNRQRPCLEFQIKRCAAPCCLTVDRNQYKNWLAQARAVLEGRTSELVQELTDSMQRAADRLDFEKAAELRDKLQILENFSKSQTYISTGAEDRDIFGIYRDGSLACLSVMLVRYGRISDNRNFAFKDVHLSDSVLLATAIEQFYQQVSELPKEIVLSSLPDNREFIDEFLNLKAGAKVDLVVPKRGIRFRLLKLAELNAQQFFSISFEQASINNLACQKLAELINIKQIPRRIECVDISNIQGSDIVGAVVSFYDGAPDKNNYRRYKISKQGKPDDFAAIYEVVSRRLERAKREDLYPDLIIIDGGRGQLDAALKAASEQSVNIDFVGLAKARSNIVSKAGKQKPERLFLPDSDKIVELVAGQDVTNFVARIRDEAHRYVITYHRKTRSKRSIASVLDQVVGLGPERKRRLLKAFGSVSNIQHATAEQVAQKGRMPLTLAVKLLKTLSM